MEGYRRLVVGSVIVVGTAVVTTLAITRAPDDGGSPRVAVGVEPVSSEATTTSTTTTTTTTTLPPVPVPIDPGPHAPVISRIETPNPVVFLTIDDGVVQDLRVVEYLREHQIPVTIFPTSPFVDENPAYFESIHALGGSVQVHTVNHRNLTKISPPEQQREICDVLPSFAARFGETPWLLRPPYGAVDTSVQYVARACGIRAVVTWRATVHDGRLETQGGLLRAGDIVLLHFRADLVHDLRFIVAQAQAQGLHPARLEDYLTPG